jgi:hypothetical protein
VAERLLACGDGDRQAQVAMIDDPVTVARLMDQLRAHLPIPALPTKPIVRALRRQGVAVSVKSALTIHTVLYLGDEAGITCDVTPARDAKTVLLVSLTQVRIPAGHPLFGAIQAYQRERVRRLAEAAFFD